MYDRGIEAFLAVAASHSVSGAANLLYITQSAVSHRLRELEEQIGLILIDRQKGIRRCELTLAGEKFYPLAERWNRLWYETKHIRKTISRLSVKIGCVDTGKIKFLQTQRRRAERVGLDDVGTGLQIF